MEKTWISILWFWSYDVLSVFQVRSLVRSALISSSSLKSLQSRCRCLTMCGSAPAPVRSINRGSVRSRRKHLAVSIATCLTSVPGAAGISIHLAQGLTIIDIVSGVTEAAERGEPPGSRGLMLLLRRSLTSTLRNHRAEWLMCDSSIGQGVNQRLYKLTLSLTNIFYIRRRSINTRWTTQQHSSEETMNHRVT